MGVLQGISGTISLFTVYPLWFYLLYKIMAAAEVSNSVWMIFSLYVIVRVISSIFAIVATIAEGDN